MLVGGAVWLGGRFLLTQTPRAVPVPVDLIVVLDVSMSLSIEDIRSEGAEAFRYIESAALPPNSQFRVFVADQDVERNLMVQGARGNPRFGPDVDSEARMMKDLETTLNKRISHYIETTPVRARTCLVNGLKGASNHFSQLTSTLHRRVLIVSDMVEDCENKGDPRSIEELRLRVAEAARDWPQGLLTGVSIVGVVPKTQGSIAIDWLRQAWKETLVSAGADSVVIGELDTILRQ